MKQNRIKLLIGLTLGLVYFSFGLLKFFPGYSPAEGLAINTIDKLLNGLIPATISIKLLALWEVSLGILFLSGRYLKLAVIFGLLHMGLTFTPLFFFPNECFHGFLRPTMLTQYILKNLVFVAAMIGLYPRR